jgi:hypothetical protein
MHQGIVSPGNSAAQMVNVLIDLGRATVLITALIEVMNLCVILQVRLSVPFY